MTSSRRALIARVVVAHEMLELVDRRGIDLEEAQSDAVGTAIVGLDPDDLGGRRDDGRRFVEAELDADLLGLAEPKWGIDEQAAAGDLAAAAVTDRCFHAEIVRSGGNEILSRLYDQLRDRQLRMGVAVMHAHPDRITKTLTEHREILEALRSDDAEAAVDLVHRHVSWFSNLARGEVR